MTHLIKKLVCFVFAITCTVLSFAQEKTVVTKIKDSLVVGSVQQLKKDVLTDLKQMQATTNQALGQLTTIQGTSIDSLLNMKNDISQLLHTKVDLFTKNKLLTIGKITLDGSYTYLPDTSQFMRGLKNFPSLLNYDAGLSLTIINMPFNFSLNGTNGSYSYARSPFDQFERFNFDHEKYMQQLQSLVLQKLNPDLVVASIVSRINTIRKVYEQSLRSEVEEVQQEFYKNYHSVLSLPSSFADLSVTDLSSLKSQLISNTDLEKYKESVDRYQELIKSGDATLLASDSVSKKMMEQINQVESLETIYSKIVSYKNKFDNNSLVKELRSHLPFTPGNFKSYLTKPGNLQQVLKEHANLNGIQSLLTQVTKLDIGQNAVQNGQLGLQNLVNTGINTEFKTNRAGVGFIYGKNNNINNLLQSGLSSFVTTEYTSLSGFKLTNGFNSLSDQSLSFNIFNFNTNPEFGNRGELLQSAYLTQGQRKDAVVTLHSGMPLSGNSQLSIELSKSFGGYSNQLSSDSTLHKTNPVSSVFGNQGSENYAAVIEYKGEIAKIPLHVIIKKVGLGYNNPGNPFLRRGETQYGLGFTRKLLKQKLLVKYDVDYRNQVFDPTKVYHYNTYSNKAQFSYRINRYDRIGLTYNSSSYHSVLVNQQDIFGSNSRWQLDGAYRFRLYDKWITSTDNFSRQYMSVPDISGKSYTSTSVLAIHTSSVAIGKNLLMMSLLANQSNNNTYYFNTSFFNAETNYSYALNNIIRLCNTIGYYENTGWNKQIGIRGQVSFLFKSLSIDVDGGYKKAIQVIKPELANQAFVTASLHYQFKK
jgi:hypothetical protein